jgi:hypothetical protein
MVTKAEQMLDFWLNDRELIGDVINFAKRIDPKCRIEGFLHTNRQRFIFSDRSQAVLENGCLKIVKR